MEPPPSCTTLSTIAVQAGGSQLVVSVLRSGGVVHLQLVRVLPGLCEIGQDREQNQTLIWEQQQLLDQLKKHESEVLSAVEKKKRRNHGGGRRVMEENQEKVYKAMAGSLAEGWSLLLQLLHRRQEVLLLASDFYGRALEFSDSMDRLENLQNGPDQVHLTYAIMRRDLLEKSLLVLSSSTHLVQRLQQLQEVERLHRTGMVPQLLEEDHLKPVWSQGTVLMLEKLVEELLDRRRKVDQAVKVHFQQKELETRREDWTILVQNLQPESPPAESADLQLDSTKSETTDSDSSSGSDVYLGSVLEKTRVLESRSFSHLNPQSRTDQKPSIKELETRREDWTILVQNLQNESIPAESADLQLDSTKSETTDSDSSSGSDVYLGSVLEKTRILESRSFSHRNPQSRTDQKPSTKELETRREDWTILVQNLQPESTPAESADLQLDSTKSETTDSDSSSGSDVYLGSVLEKTRVLESIAFSHLNPQSRTDQKPSIKELETRREDWTILVQNLQPESTPAESADLQLDSAKSETTDSDSSSGSDVCLGSVLEKTRILESRSFSHLNPQSRTDQKPSIKPDIKSGSGPEQSMDPKPGLRIEEEQEQENQPGSRSDLKSAQGIQTMSGLQDIRNLRSRFRLVSEGSSSDLKSRDSLSESCSVLRPGSRSEKTKELQVEPSADLKSVSRPAESMNLEIRLEQIPVSEEVLKAHPGTRSDPNTKLSLGVKPETIDLHTESTVADLLPGSHLEQTRCLLSRLRLNQSPESRSESNSKPELTRDNQLGSRSGPASGSRDLQPGSTSETKSEIRSESKNNQLESEPDQRPGSSQELDSDPRSQNTTTSEAESKYGLKTTSVSEKTLESSPEETSVVHLGPESEAKPEPISGKRDLHSGSGSEPQAEPTSAETRILEPGSGSGVKARSGSDQRSGPRPQVPPGSGSEDSENPQILDQNPALPPGPTCRPASMVPGKPRGPVSPLKALTEQLKRGTKTSTIQPSAPPAGSQSPEPAAPVDQVLTDVQSLDLKIQNMQLLQSYNLFLRTAKQVEEQMEELREVYRRSISEAEQVSAPGSPQKEKVEQVSPSWQETLQSLLTAQELGTSYVHSANKALDSGLDLQSVVSVVQETMEKLNRTKVEVTELWNRQQVQIQQQHEEDLRFCRKYRNRLLKNLQDLAGVSELMDSCTVIDLGSELQTSRLLDRFKQARPHFTKLEAELDYVKKSWETLRGVQERVEVKEEDLTELLKLHHRVTEKIQHRESVLEQSNRFHLAAKQLEALLLSPPTADLQGLEEEQELVQSLFETVSTLKTNICDATEAESRGGASFRSEQLQSRFLSLDSLCVSWISDAVRRQEKLRLLRDDITQVRDSFKELKKRFHNLRVGFLKKSGGARNPKAVRNQLQQVEMNQEKLQGLRRRLQEVAEQLGSEVKARELEDSLNQLQRQVGEFERNVGEHQKTLELTIRLQEAMEEYQFWCDEASATIARVGKFSSECRSPEAVSVLHQQFQKFVLPTVPQQEERIGQIVDLAVQLHGAEEGRRYTEKTLSKHSQMVSSIGSLSDALLKLEQELQLDDVKKGLEEDEEEKEKESKMEERSKKKNKEAEEVEQEMEKEVDNRSRQEVVDMEELKETGHTPELTAKLSPKLTAAHGGGEAPAKRHSAAPANRKPPLQKSRSLDVEKQTLPSESSDRFSSAHSSTHTVTLCRSTVDTNRRVTPFLSTDHGEGHRKDLQETGPDASVNPMLETEVQVQDLMTEDLLSNDEYECPSPDDISLPPMAETPESGMVQWDLDEGSCFSSHSAHVNQDVQSYQVQSEQSRSCSDGAVIQQEHTESSWTEACLVPPVSPHSSSRVRSESTSFVHNLSAGPAPGFLSSTSCNIRPSEENGACHSSQISTEPNLVLKYHPQDTCSRKDGEVLDAEPKRTSDSQGRHHETVSSRSETLSETDPVPHRTESSQGQILDVSGNCPEHSSGLDTDVHMEEVSSHCKRVFKCGTSFPQTTITGQDSSFTHLTTVSRPQENVSTSTSSDMQKVYVKLKPQVRRSAPSHCIKGSASDTTPALGFEILESREPCFKTNITCSEAIDHPGSDVNSPTDHEPCGTSSETSNEASFMNIGQNSSSQTTTSSSSSSSSSWSYTKQVINCRSSSQTDRTSWPKDEGSDSCSSDNHAPHFLEPPRLCNIKSECRSGLDQREPSSETSNETSSGNIPHSGSSRTTTTSSVSQQASPSDTQTSTTLELKKSGSGSCGGDVHFLEPVTVRNISVSSRTITSNKESSETDCRSGPDQRETSSETSSEASSVNIPKSSSLTVTRPISQQNSLSDTQTSGTSRSKQGGSCPHSRDVHAPHFPEPPSISNTSDSGGTITSSKQRSGPDCRSGLDQRGSGFHSGDTTTVSSTIVSSGTPPSSEQTCQTLFSFHESVTPTCTQQFVHDPGMSPSCFTKSTSPQTQALSQQPNPHATPPSSPPHLLTSDPDICRPVCIREEIRLTPQIQGPPLPAPPPPPPLSQVQAESLPQGKASKAGPSCFIRPLSRATVMEGSPVTLEVEVTGDPEPTLTRCEDQGVSPADRDHLPLVPGVSDSEVQTVDDLGAAGPRETQRPSGDKWLVEEVFDIIYEDWDTWFGSLCVLLWLLYLVLL